MTIKSTKVLYKLKTKSEQCNKNKTIAYNEISTKRKNIITNKGSQVSLKAREKKYVFKRDLKMDIDWAARM